MQKEILIIYILFLPATFFQITFGEAQASYFDYSLKETPYALIDESGKNLNTLSTKDWKYHIFGVYRKKLSLLSGNHLYLFPNMKYVITKWGDMLVEYKVDEGKWGISNGKVAFRSSIKVARQHFLINKNGGMQMLNFFVTGDSKKIDNAFLIDDTSLEAIAKDPNHKGYLIKIISYIDWEEDFKAFIN